MSETDTIISESHDTGMGGVSSTQHVFCKDLSGAFAENSSFKHVVIPQNLTKVANYMFYKNTSVESVKLPSNAMAFGKKVFEGAAELKTVNIPDGIKEIPEKTFRNTSMETVHLPSSVEVIGDWAFGEVPVKNIDLSKVKIVGDHAFYDNCIGCDGGGILMLFCRFRFRI